MQNVQQLLQSDPLVKLLQKENFVGWIYSIDYDSARVMTNDLWKANSLGVPHNCFLLAASFNPEEFANVPSADREVILLRVIGTCTLPQDDDLVRTKVDHFQSRTGIFSENGQKDFDDLTLNQIQFGGLECRVLGTFYTKDGQLFLGSDLESFSTATRLSVYRPRGAALELVANHVDPLRRKSALEEAKQLGIEKPVAPFRIGTVRYTSTDRLHRKDQSEHIAVHIQPSDFLARRTAVLGMTRTGKSNMIKQLVSVVKRVADEGGVKIGQIIYDINGEYANANQQDKGAIADIYPDQTVRYRMLQTPGFRELQNNFYLQLTEGFNTIRGVLKEEGTSSAADLKVFLNTSFEQPDPQEQSTFRRWRVRAAAYQAMLFKAGFEPPPNHRVTFDANKEVREAVNAAAGEELKNPSSGLSLKEAVEWFTAVRTANRAQPLISAGKKLWLDDDTSAILNMLTNKNANDAYINGYKVLADVRKYHSPRRSQEVGDEVYEELVNGKIVILDLSVGDPTLRQKISDQVAFTIFSKSMNIFIEGKLPPNIVVYIEEAHNLIGKEHALTDTWPRLAKEGAKYRIALVYATQEVSSVHPNILANTENWFISHLNNDREIKELARFYDFADFSRSLLRAQDVGFTRVKSLSSPFVIPVQIDKFDPETEKERVQALGNSSSQAKASKAAGK